MTTKKWIILSVSCSLVFFILGAGAYHLYQLKQSKGLEDSIEVETVKGEPGTIEHGKIKNKPKCIEFITKSKGKGQIKTLIKKVDFCPKIYKNSLTFGLSGGILDNMMLVNYGIQYRRQIFSRFHVQTGLHVITLSNMPKGFYMDLGVGINF